MNYVVTRHARRRMQQRNVSEQDIQAVIAAPVSMWDDPSQGSVVVKGVGAKGRLVTLFVVGALPLSEPWTIKSVA